MADKRACEQCSALFVPRREHARFCSRNCRVSWYRDQFGDVTVGPSALEWSVAAVGESIDRLARWGVWEHADAFEAISDAVWRVTMLDAALVRHRPRAYDNALGVLEGDERASIEQTLAGLRLVRNGIGEPTDLARFVATAPIEHGPTTGRITGWRWKSVPAPSRDSRSQASRAWEQTRHQAYENRLAGTAVGDTFTRCEHFLVPAAHAALSIARGHSVAR
jgi:hypothetical protein